MKAFLIGALCIALAPAPVLAAGFDLGTQMELYLLGFYDGKLDGVLGPASRKAIEAYQKSRNLPVTGRVDRETDDKLIKWEMEQGRLREIEITDSMKSAAAESVKKDLIDPYSAVFEYDAAYTAPSASGPVKHVCGTVNAKNRFGAFVGRTYFAAALVGGEGYYTAISMMDGPDSHPMAEMMCLLRLGFHGV